MVKQSKRENFEVTPEQESDIDCLKDLLKSSTRKDALLTAVQLALFVATESRKGKEFYMGKSGGRDLCRLFMLGIESPNAQKWTYLTEHAHPWKKELYVKGRKLPAGAVWSAMMVNKLTREEAADDWDLPIEAIDEIVAYCEENKTLLQMESAEELRLLESMGVKIEP